MPWGSPIFPSTQMPEDVNISFCHLHIGLFAVDQEAIRISLDSKCVSFVGLHCLSVLLIGQFSKPGCIANVKPFSHTVTVLIVLSTGKAKSCI